ncbi:MAG TPA: galactose oxidase-like domain-containing protein [Bryobacteraceae bacterium]|jgi:hypothetical protein|nr:galactose oxidase-like domain-containing protein [Bryobacteraceae bacterium]
MRIRALLLALIGLTHTVQAAITIDAKVATDQSSASSTVTSPALSTTSGQELLLAFIATDYLQGANTTVTSVSGGGLTWQLVGRTNVQSGDSEIWRAFAPSALNAVYVTATLSQSVISSITVVSFAGVDTTGTNGSGAIGAVASANATKGAPSATLKTTRNGSLVFGVGNDFDNATARTPGTNQSLVHQFLTSAGDTYWVQMQNSAIAASATSVSINDTAPTGDRYNLEICEILANTTTTPTWSASGSITPASSGSGATLTLSGAASATVTADSSGNYSFSGLSNGSYTITPSKSGFTFSPASEPITISGANQTGIDFAAQPLPTWSVSGTVSPAASGSGTTMMLTGASSAAATADSSGNYSFTGLTNGSYTVTPSKGGYTFTPTQQGVTVNSANVTGVNFSASASSNLITIDAQVSKDQTSASATVTTPSFSTSAGNELLLAFVATDYLGGANTSVQSVTGGGLTWVLVGRTNVQSGDSEIWRAFSAVPLSSISVSATLSQSVMSSITVVSFSGVNTSGSNGSGAIGAVASASATTGAPSASLTTLDSNSMIFGVGNDFDNAIARTPGANQTLVHQYLSSAGDTYWVQKLNNPVPAGGTKVTINDTAPTTDRYNLTICEIIAGSGTGVIPVAPTVTMTSPSSGTVAGTVTVSANVTDNVAITSVQFLLDGSPLGSALTTAPYSMSWNSATVSDGSHTLAAQAVNSANQGTTSSPVNITVNNSGSGSLIGSWSSPVSLPAVAVNLILLHNNTILFYQDGQTPTVWDYIHNTFTSVPFNNADLFCSGAALLADGRVFVAGGYSDQSDPIGIANAEIFDPSNNTWTVVPNMKYKRWYPNVLTLSDGRMMVTAGWQTTAHSNAGISEIYNPSTNTWTQLTNANNPFETYPFLYQMPDGRVIHIGGSEYATDTDILDINAQTWTVVDSNVVDGASATMYAPGKFMKAGTATDSQGGSGPVTNTTYVLDMTQNSPAWKQTASMAYNRSFLNLTMLPDGTVLATGGETDRNGGNIANAVYAAELWNPQTMTWSTLASMHTPREYHGTALLLPDGRVLESGMGADFGNVPNELSAEFFSPPYLFKGARPTITSAPTEWTYGSNFTVVTPDAASIAKVALIRTGAVTHFFDENERYLPLSFQAGSGQLTVTAPANAYLAPPGYYMLFIVNNAGVPSVAPFVHFAGN